VRDHGLTYFDIYDALIIYMVRYFIWA